MWTSLLRLSPAFCLAATLAPAGFVAAADLMPTKNDAQATKATASNRDEKKPSSSSSSDDAAIRARAEKLHRHSIVIDTHNDITSPLVDDGFDLGMRGDDPNAKVRTHTDLRRMKAGGLGAEFFAVYVGKEFVNKKPSEGGGQLGERWMSSMLFANRCAVTPSHSRWLRLRLTSGASQKAERSPRSWE